MSEQMHNQQSKIAGLINRYSTQDGTHKTAIPSLFFTRLSKTPSVRF